MFSSIFNIIMATLKFTNFDKFFKMPADVTAVTIQSNKIVSNEIKDSQVLLEPSYGKNQTKVLVSPVLK